MKLVHDTLDRPARTIASRRAIGHGLDVLQGMVTAYCLSWGLGPCPDWRRLTTLPRAPRWRRLRLRHSTTCTHADSPLPHERS